MNGLAEILHLLAPVTHGRQQCPDVRIVLEGLRDRADRARSRIDQLARAVLLRGEDGGAEGHLAVGQRGPVFHGQNALTSDLVRVAFDVERRCREHDRRVPSVLVNRVEDRVDAFLRRAVDLVHDADVCHSQVRLARVVAELVAGAMRVDDDDVEIGLDERRVVVAAVPEDHVCLALRGPEDSFVVDPREYEVPLGEVRLVLFALLDGRVRGVEILVALEPLHGLLRQVAVGHRMAQHGDALAGLAEESGNMAGRLALAGASPHCADRHRRLRCGQHRVMWRDQVVRRASSQCA